MPQGHCMFASHTRGRPWGVDELVAVPGWVPKRLKGHERNRFSSNPFRALHDNGGQEYCMSVCRIMDRYTQFNQLYV